MKSRRLICFLNAFWADAGACCLNRKASRRKSTHDRQFNFGRNSKEFGVCIQATRLFPETKKIVILTVQIAENTGKNCEIEDMFHPGGNPDEPRVGRV